MILLRAIDAQVRAGVLRENSAWLHDEAQAVRATSKRVRAKARRRRRSYKTSKRAA